MQEDLEDTSLGEANEEEKNLCLIANTISKASNTEQDSEVDFNDLKSLQEAQHELLSNSSIL